MLVSKISRPKELRLLNESDEDVAEKFISNLGQGDILLRRGHETAALGSSRPLRQLHGTRAHRRPNPHEQFSQEPTGTAAAAPATTSTSAAAPTATVAATAAATPPPTNCDPDERGPRRPADQLQDGGHDAAEELPAAAEDARRPA